MAKILHMINFYIDPYPEEILYSAAARYHYYSGNLDFKDTLKELFGTESAIPTIAFPSRLDYLANQLSGKYTGDYFIANHTLLSVYAPFLPPDRLAEIIHEMKYGDSKGLYTKIGMVAGSVCTKKGLYYCPGCVREDVAKLKETYFRRVHQVQGVYVCPEHGCWLKEYPLTRQQVSRIQFIRLNHEIIDYRPEYEADSLMREKLLKLAFGVSFLLKSGLNLSNQTEVHGRYINLLADKGLLTCNGRIKQRELHEEFRDFYGSRFLDKLESDLNSGNEFNWLKVVTRRPKRVVHPIRHLLFILFLCGEIKEFFYNDTNCSEPFGGGPWPCLNPVAEHFRQPVIRNVTVTADYRTRQPVGTFECNCGFVYSRRGPDKELGDCHKIGRIKSFGSVWETKLKAFLNERYWGLRELAKTMCCDPKTIVKFANKLGLREKINSNMVVKMAGSQKKSSDNYRHKYSQDILNFIREYPDCARTQVRIHLQKQYAWFYRNDPQWLQANLPPRLSGRNGTKIVDWNQRDAEMVEEIEQVYNKLRNLDKPIRITKSIIGARVGKTATLEVNLDKLPETKRYLEHITEPITDFQMRRVELVAKKLFDQKGSFVKWEVLRKAGLRPGVSRLVDNHIDKMIDQYCKLC